MAKKKKVEEPETLEEVVPVDVVETCMCDCGAPMVLVENVPDEASNGFVGSKLFKCTVCHKQKRDVIRRGEIK